MNCPGCGKEVRPARTACSTAVFERRLGGRWRLAGARMAYHGTGGSYALHRCKLTEHLWGADKTVVPIPRQPRRRWVPK